MKKFIAYFDYLGFKQFITNNDFARQKKGILNNLRDIEIALSRGRTRRLGNNVVVPDISGSNINCVNFSDTVVFWTKDASNNSLQELIDVAHQFNWRTILYFFPVRGALVFEEIGDINYCSNESAASYSVSSLWGKGLIMAHMKAESQNWAGTVLCQSFVDEIIKRDLDINAELSKYAKKYKVPYHDNPDNPKEEYVFKLVKNNLCDESFKNFAEGIKRNFADYNKSTASQSVQQKLDNTLTFLKSFVK